MEQPSGVGAVSSLFYSVKRVDAFRLLLCALGAGARAAFGLRTLEFGDWVSGCLCVHF